MPLRESLGVSDSSPLRSVQMRNRFEHFDEDLEDWHRRGRVNYADLNVGMLLDFDTKDVFRGYNQLTKVVTFATFECSVQEIVGEATVLLAAATDKLQQPLPPKQSSTASTTAAAYA
jgi:hypothetical protein